ncbi:TNF receptor-associated factor 6 [Nematostella vectensis]|uniref:TNF receptor-associated factor 6 n=1 Tax=Nematostella vectensis TaxID=45351 RepID=UPI0020770332|nr:TNF receptor-associated factor 6 [Nematostella vectensis]
MADPSPVPSGYDSEFVIAVAEEYTCRICHLPLRVPVQTKCGHRFCKECLDEASRRKSRAECPMDREPLDLKKDVFLDKAAERTILSFLVKCPCKGCKWEAELRDLEAHARNCDYKLVTCSNPMCSAQLPRMDVDEHLLVECDWRLIVCEYCGDESPYCLQKDHSNQCDKFPVLCPNDCGTQITREKLRDHQSEECQFAVVPCAFRDFGCEVEIQNRLMDQHLDTNIQSHLNMTCNQLLLSRDVCASLQTELTATKENLSSAKQQVAALTKESQILLKEKLEMTKHMKELTKKMDVLESRVRQNSAKVTTVRGESGAQFHELQQGLGRVNEVLKMRFVWRIPDFADSLRQAKLGLKVRLDSEPFFTEKNGYKLRATLYPNGTMSGKNTHISAFVSINRGEYDGILAWPFTRVIKITLLDQKENVLQRRNVEQTIIPNPSLENFHRPKTVSNNGRGSATFVSHEKLWTENYVVDGTLFMQVEVSSG